MPGVRNLRTLPAFAPTANQIAAKRMRNNAGVARPGAAGVMSSTGEAVPPELLQIQGVWIILNNRLVAGSVQQSNASRDSANLIELGVGGGREDREKDTSDTTNEPICIVEEASFRASHDIERHYRLFVDEDDGSGVPTIMYIDDNQQHCRGTLLKDSRTGNLTLNWGNQQVWEPAVTPLLPEEETDRELYGFTLENAKQNLNNFFQKRKLEMVTLKCDPLEVVSGFRSSVDMMVTNKERLRCSCVSASKKAATCELAMRVCKMLCRR